jgi:hypothetical protein
MKGKAHGQQGTHRGYQLLNSIACGEGISQELMLLHLCGANSRVAEHGGIGA